jgi:hypothetical protein
MHSAVFRQARQPAVVWSVFPVYAAAVAGVEPVVASQRGRTVVDPDRNLSTWLHGVSAASDHAPWVLRAAMLVADGHSPGLSTILPAITNEPALLAFWLRWQARHWCSSPGPG